MSYHYIFYCILLTMLRFFYDEPVLCPALRDIALHENPRTGVYMYICVCVCVKTRIIWHIGAIHDCIYGCVFIF